jgi:MFS family permease
MNWHVLSLACLGPTYLMAALLAAVWNWEAFYLVCFLVGFVLAVISFLTGVVHLHLPGDLHGGDAGHVDAGHAHAGDLDHGTHGAQATFGHQLGRAAARVHGVSEHGASPFNTFSIMAFLAWFGGTGYLLTRTHSLVALVIFVIAGLAGLIGATIVFLFLARVLMASDRPLDPVDYDMIGVLARVNSRIRRGGTGEIVFDMAGTRRSASARAEDGALLDKGVEVVVTRYENGIAYVRTWEQMTGEEQWSIRSDKQ